MVHVYMAYMCSMGVYICVYGVCVYRLCTCVGSGSILKSGPLGVGLVFIHLWAYDAEIMITNMDLGITG